MTSRGPAPKGGRFRSAVSTGSIPNHEEKQDRGRWMSQPRALQNSTNTHARRAQQHKQLTPPPTDTTQGPPSPVLAATASSPGTQNGSARRSPSPHEAIDPDDRIGVKERRDGGHVIIVVLGGELELETWPGVLERFRTTTDDDNGSKSGERALWRTNSA
ncbi:hypothetical protein BKA93DRAFT_822049 [Sparassis latifolia]